MPENAVYDRDASNSHAYASHHYSVLAEAGWQILVTVRDFFGWAAFALLARGDDSSEADLHPELSVLPFYGEGACRDGGATFLMGESHSSMDEFVRRGPAVILRAAGLRGLRHSLHGGPRTV